jgi:hypothetical protein
MYYVMPRGRVTKNDILHRVYKMKTELYDGKHKDKPGQWHDGAHDAYNRILELLDQFSS